MLMIQTSRSMAGHTSVTLMLHWWILAPRDHIKKPWRDQLRKQPSVTETAPNKVRDMMKYFARLMNERTRVDWYRIVYWGFLAADASFSALLISFSCTILFEQNLSVSTLFSTLEIPSMRSTISISLADNVLVVQRRIDGRERLTKGKGQIIGYL